LPSDFLTTIDNTFSVDNFEIITAIVISSGILIQYNEDIRKEAIRFAENSKIIKKKETGREKGDFLDYPKSLNSSLSYIGNFLQLGTTSSLAIYGFINKDPRALQTTSQIIESYFLSGIFSQLVKRMAGKDYPYKADKPKGDWNLLMINQSNYNNHVRRYGSFPSGRVATMMSSITVLSENYPEYHYIKPVGYSMLATMMLGMLMGQEHWISDYLIAIAIGHVSAKTVLNKRLKTDEDIYRYKPFYQINPLQFPSNGIGIALSYHY
jgi:hypothetical protein